MTGSCTLFKTAKWRHCKGKSHSGRLQSPGAQDIKFQVIPLPQTSCVTFSKSVSLVNVPKRVSWGLSSVCPKTKLPVSLIFEDSHPWPHVEHTRSCHSKQAHWLCVLQSTPGEGLSGCSQFTVSTDSRWMYRWTCSSCPFLFNGKSAEQDYRYTVHKWELSYLLCITCKNILRSQHYFLYLNLH